MRMTESTKSVIKNNSLLKGTKRAVVVYQTMNNGSDLIIVDINDIAENIEKVNKVDIIGKNINEVFTGAKKFGIIEVINRVWRTGAPEHIDLKEYKDERTSGWRETDVIKLQTSEVAVIYDDKTAQKLTEQQLKECADRYNKIISTSIDGFIMYDKKGNITETNASFLKIVGYTRDEIMQKNVFDVCLPRENSDYLDVVKKLKSPGHSCFETQCLCKNGKHVDVEISSNNTDNGRLAFSFIRDISGRKQREMELFFVGYHDKLTGLYNRAFFEEEVRRLDNDRQYPISIIISDVNGLKAANDSFGHECGDNLLKKYASILNSCLRKDDIAARWGGDEFVILLPKTTSKVANQICERINSKSSKAMVGMVSLSVAIGCGTKTSSDQNFNDVIINAEDLMYQNKLLNTKSIRNETVSSLMKTMYEMNYETEENAKRVLDIVATIGKKLDLMPQEIEELKLISVLHDIGKIGVSKEIISKPSSLNEEEWVEVKRHSEIGYRIAELTPGLAHISKYILSIHERWDGKGYQQGLKGNAIPKLSRIMSIVDAFDAMTSGRPYKERMTVQEAYEEIKRCSGTQFDPFLVDLFVKLDLGK